MAAYTYVQEGSDSSTQQRLYNLRTVHLFIWPDVGLALKAFSMESPVFEDEPCLH